jgi:tetratricopeptide (TPR) repeat protein
MREYRWAGRNTMKTSRADSSNRRKGLRFASFLLVALGTLTGCFIGGSSEGAMLRGDEAFARGDFTEALAEYRLALRQGDRDPEILVRTAHAYASTGRISEARDHYREAILQDPELADLASADLLRVAKRAADRRDGIGAATAVTAAMELKPGVSLTGIALPLARHFAQNGDYGQALPFFQQAVGEENLDPVVVFEMAKVHDEIGDCRSAVVFYDQVRTGLSVADRSELDWRTGNCSMELARESLLEEDLEEALDFYRVTIDLGEPRGRLAEAWFETGEILAQSGECTAATRAFEQAIREDLTGVFGDRARARVDQIRFRPGGGGPC